MGLFEGLGDDSTKRMPVENIKMPWLPEFNALARGVVEYRFRPNTWDDYFENIRHMRERVIAAFQDLSTALRKASKDGGIPLQNVEGWDECKRVVNGDTFLPKSAVDEWGFLTESRDKKLEDEFRIPESTEESRTKNVKDELRTKKLSAISTLDPFNKAINEYTRAVGTFMDQALHALVLVPLLNTKIDADRKAKIAKAKELGITETTIRLSIVNGIDACTAVRQLHRVERSVLHDDQVESADSFRAEELEVFLSTMRSLAVFSYPEQILPNAPKQKKKKRRANRPRPAIELRGSLRATRNRVDHTLKKLKAEGITTSIVSEDIRWNEDSALWITFDTYHPLGALVAIEKIWFALVGAFRPDRDKIVRQKAIDWFWEKVILVPFVQGRSIARQAYANLKGASYPVDENPAKQLWRFVPEEVPEDAWVQLRLSAWERQPSWEIFEKFADAYGALFQHVDHMADFARCMVDLDELGEEIFLRYLRVEAKRAEPFLQETFDSCAGLLEQFPKLEESVVAARPNILNCLHLIVEMEGSIRPSEDFDEKGGLTIEAMADWRNRLKGGFNLLGEAQALWIADSLGFAGFDYGE